MFFVFIDPEDFTNLLSTFIFNEATSINCADIPIQDDDISEDPEDFAVVISSEDPDVSSTRPMANVTIIDNDNVTIGFEMEVYPAREDQGTVQVCARLMEGSLGREVAIILSTQDGSAREPEDYAGVSVTLSFDETTVVQCANITLGNDSVLEGVEEFQVVLDSGDEEGIELSPERAVVMITDDDGKL